MSLESLSTEFSIELSHFIDSTVESELNNLSFESSSTITPNVSSARATNQISLKMDEINKELEDIKNSIHLSPDTSYKMTNKSHHNHLDRFDSIPSNIKAYIRQEIQCLNEKLPAMIAKAVKEEIQCILSNQNSKFTAPVSPNKISRPPWDNDFAKKIPNADTISSKLKKKSC